MIRIFGSVNKMLKQDHLSEGCIPVELCFTDRNLAFYPVLEILICQRLGLYHPVTQLGGARVSRGSKCSDSRE